MDAFANKVWKESFKMFYQEHARAFWYFILKTCGDESLADDIFQESFARFLRAAPTQLEEHQQRAYLYKIALRLVIDQQRKVKREKEYARQEVEFNPAGESRENPGLLSIDMERVFRLLKPRERSLLWLAYVEGYSHKEISRITDAKEKSIKVQLFRTKKKFARILRQKGFEPSKREELR